VSLRVVHADDDDAYRLLLRELLRGRDDVELVGEARDADALLAAVRELRPDVVLLDQLAGASAVEELHALGARVVVLSGYDPQTGDQALREAADAWVVKAVDVGPLLTAILG
jgi:DNA-binding NarL/FixJ family response regulator